MHEYDIDCVKVCASCYVVHCGSVIVARYSRSLNVRVKFNAMHHKYLIWRLLCYKYGSLKISSALWGKIGLQIER